jgi:hypothetical protein
MRNNGESSPAFYFFSHLLKCTITKSNAKVRKNGERVAAFAVFFAF